MLNRIYSYFFNKSSQIRESFSKEEGQAPWRARVFSIFALFIFELLTAFLKFTILLTQPSYESFQTFTRQHTLPVCEYSYFDHKRFQKRVRLFSLAGLSSVVSATIIINLIMSLILPGQLPSYAKTVTGGWDDWSLTNLAGDPPVGSAGSLTISPANYSEISGTGTDSYLGLKKISYWAQDDGAITKSDGTGGYGTSSATGGTFGGVGTTNSSTIVSGTGTGASVGLNKNNNAWISSSIDSGWGADYVKSIDAIDANNIFVSYKKQLSGDNMDIKFAKSTNGGSTWTISTIDSGLSFGTNNSIDAIDANNIFISYTASANGLKFAKSTNGGSTWTISTIDSGANAGYSGVSISAIDANNIFVSYDNGSSSTLFAKSTNGGSTWTISTIDTYAGYQMAQASIRAIDANNIFISYAISSVELRFAKSTNGGSTWTISTIASGGTYNSISAIDANNIFVSYYTSNGLSFAKSTNGGSTWTNSTIEGGGTSGINGAYNSISAIDANNIFVSYHGNDIDGSCNYRGCLRFAKSTNGGSTWTISTIDNVGAYGVGAHTSIRAIDANNIFISYGRGDSYEVKFAGPGYSNGVFTSAPINLGAAVKPTTASFNQTVSGGGTGKSWGYNLYGQLGDGTNTDRSTPVTVCNTGATAGTCDANPLTNVVAIAGGDYQAFALKSDGTVKAWGYNIGLGTLGDGTTTNRNTPVTVCNTGATAGTCDANPLTNVVAIATEYNHSLALLFDGTVKAWGANSGQLGDGTQTNRTTPVTVCNTGATAGTCDANPLTNVVAIAAGSYYSLALLSDGTIKAWGANNNGQLGDGTSTYRTTPVTVCNTGATAGTCDANPLTNVVAIAGGGNHSLALLSDGTVKAWGYNGSGQLGDGTSGSGTNKTTPVSVSGITNVVAIEGGDNNSFALKSDGTVKAWGYSSWGQLGDGTQTNRTTPVTVCNTGATAGTCDANPLTNVVAIAAGFYHIFALKSDGTVKAWGYNGSGQLGDRTSTYRTTPVTVCNTGATAGTCDANPLTNVVAIATGSSHSLALTGGLRFQIAGNTDNSTWTYKPLPRQVGVSSNRLVIPPDLNGSQYIRYKAYLSTNNSAYTPSLDDLKINYTSYPATSTVSNLKFDSGSSNVTWSQVQWVRQDANTAVSTIKTKAQVRVASSDAGLTGSFVGYNGTTTNAGTYFDKFGSGQTNCSEVPGKFGDTSDPNANKKTVTCLLLSTDTVINPAVGIGSNRWLELQLTLESDGSSTPQIDATRVIYAANKAPGVTIAVSPVIEQSKIIADYGYVTFNASINDEDTGTGTTLPHSGATGWAFVALEYSTGGSFGTEPTISSHSYFNGTNFASAGNFTITRTSSNITKNCIAVTDSSALVAENITQTPSTSAWKYACPVDKTLDASGNSVTFTDYSVKWNVKNQIDNTYSPSTAKVRLWTTDMEGANSVGYTTSSGFIINTTNPTGSISKFSAIPAGVSGDTTSPGIYITANDDDTTISYKLSDNCYSGASGDWATLYTSWVSPVSSPIGCSFLTTNENTGRIYAPYFSLKDSYGNEKAASAPMTSGQRPINIVLQDVSNVLATPASYKLFMSWEVIATPVNGFASYNIYRCSAPESDPTCSQNSNYSLYNAVTGGTAVNYFTDSNVTGAATYYYRIATKDSVGNISNWSAPLKACVNGTQDCDEGGGGGDTTPVTISSIQIPPASITQNSAIITWTTSKIANAGVFYSTNTSYGSEKSSLSYATSQSIALSGLSSGATYNIKLKSIDASGNTTICDAVSSSSVTTAANKTTATNSSPYCPTGATLSFPTLTTDTTAPVISNVSISSITSSGATVAWTTKNSIGVDENSDSYVGSDSATSARTYLNEQGNSDSVTSHSVTIGALSSTTTYYIKIKSRDASGNLAQNCSTENKTDCPSVSDASLTFTTTAPVSAGGGGGGGGKSDFTPPGISDIKISDITSSSAVAVWQTNELASSFVEYGIKKDNLDRTQGQFDNVSDHKVALKDLAEGVKYYYKIKSVDWAGNVGESDIQIFTTKGIALSLAETAMSEADKEKTQAVLEDLKKQIEEQGGSITDPLTALLDSVSSLIPEPIIIGESPKVELETTSATISWRTDKNSTSFVAFVRDDQYDSQKDEPYVSVVGNPEDSVKEHIVKIANILPATKYHYQVRSKALLGGMSKSKDFTFMTKSALPEISNYLQKKTEDEKTAAVYWETNVPSDSVVKYTPYVSGKLEKKLAKIIGKSDMVTDHEVSVTELNPGTIYQFEISSRDPFGNVVSKVLPDFTTAIDKDAPVVSQVRIESAMVSGKTPRIQTIVSYKTDEPALGQVMFTEGGSNDFKEMAMETAFSTTHTAVITEFKPASIYRIRVVAKDNSENIAASRDFTILTPAKSESIIDIIVRTFENTFGWMKNIRF